MKVITLWQPWATLIQWKWKTIETRTHDRFRNLVGETIGIHAGNYWDKHIYELAGPYLTDMQRSEIGMIKEVFDNGHEKGEIICTAEVDATGWLSPDDSQAALIECNCDWAPNRFGLFLKDIQPIKPIKATGHQGIWNFDIKPEEIVYL